MTAFGYTLSSEEHPPRQLVQLARRAEEVGFDFLTISDHFWVSPAGEGGSVAAEGEHGEGDEGVGVRGTRRRCG